MDHAPAYGLWTLVVINSLVFILFAFSFTKPRTARDWRSLGVFSAFIVALFTEMYGFPLTVYLLSGWITQRFPGIDPLSHESGHLWHTLLGLKGDPHFDILHLLSTVFIVGGFWLLASAWRVLHVQAPRATRRARCLGGFRGHLPSVHAADAAIHSALGSAYKDQRGVKWLSVRRGENDPAYPLRSPFLSSWLVPRRR